MVLVASTTSLPGGYDTVTPNVLTSKQSLQRSRYIVVSCMKDVRKVVVLLPTMSGNRFSRSGSRRIHTGTPLPQDFWMVPQDLLGHVFINAVCLTEQRRLRRKCSALAHSLVFPPDKGIQWGPSMISLFSTFPHSSRKSLSWPLVSFFSVI